MESDLNRCTPKDGLLFVGLLWCIWCCCIHGPILICHSHWKATKGSAGRSFHCCCYRRPFSLQAICLCLVYNSRRYGCTCLSYFKWALVIRWSKERSLLATTWVQQAIYIQYDKWISLIFSHFKYAVISKKSVGYKHVLKNIYRGYAVLLGE